MAINLSAFIRMQQHNRNDLIINLDIIKSIDRFAIGAGILIAALAVQINDFEGVHDLLIHDISY